MKRNSIRRSSFSLFPIIFIVLLVSPIIGAVEVGFSPPLFNSTITSFAIQSDGKILVGGSFTSADGVSRVSVLRLNSDGTVDPTFHNPHVSTGVLSIAVQKDGKIVVGGEFGFVHGQERRYLARLNPDGSLDASFNPVIDKRVHKVVILGDGKILIGGRFDIVGGQSRRCLARLLSDGNVDPAFADPAIQDSRGFVIPVVNDIAVATDGKIVAGGEFNRVGVAVRNFVARFTETGQLDDQFIDPLLSGGNQGTEVSALSIQSDNRIVIGGSFGSVGGQVRRAVARLEPNGSPDLSFQDPAVTTPIVIGKVRTVDIGSDGRILIGGDFARVNGVPRGRLARLNEDGSLDISFPDHTIVGGVLTTLKMQPDGKILIGGLFTNVYNRPRNKLTRLLASGGLDVPSPRTFVVNKVSDTNDGICDSDCSLREAVQAANDSESDDTINFDPAAFSSAQTIVLSHGQLAVCNAGTLSLNGTGSSLLTLSGNDNTRIFRVFPEATASLNSLKLTNGSSGFGPFEGCPPDFTSDFSYGGGAIENRGTLHLNNSIVANNETTGSGGGISNVFGNSIIVNSVIHQNLANSSGAIFSIGGVVHISGSTIHNNVTNSKFGNGGGGIGCTEGASVYVTNSTIAHNSSAVYGGGIMNISSTVHLESSTIARNSATERGGGIMGMQMTPTPPVFFIRNSIVANNNAPTNIDVDGNFISQGFNLIRMPTGANISGDTATNIYNTDPLLDNTLRSYHGGTPMFALLRGSPAIDKGLPGEGVIMDQRGLPRPFDFIAIPNAQAGNGSDIGAFELRDFASRIEGRITPPPGRVLRNATITLRNLSDGTSRVRPVHYTGLYRFMNVPTGDEYELVVEHKTLTFQTLRMTINGELYNVDFSGQVQ